jgi:hypothetical protein
MDNTGKQVDRTSHRTEKMIPDLRGDGTMTTTVGHVDMISNIQVKHANTSKTRLITKKKQQQPTPRMDPVAISTSEHKEFGGMTS